MSVVDNTRAVDWPLPAHIVPGTYLLHRHHLSDLRVVVTDDAEILTRHPDTGQWTDLISHYDNATCDWTPIPARLLVRARAAATTLHDLTAAAIDMGHPVEAAWTPGQIDRFLSEWVADQTARALAIDMLTALLRETDERDPQTLATLVVDNGFRRTRQPADDAPF